MTIMDMSVNDTCSQKTLVRANWGILRQMDNEIYVQKNKIVPFGMGLAGALQYADWVHLASQLQ